MSKVVTGKVRIDQVYLESPRSINGGEARYSVCLIVDKEDLEGVACIEKGIEEALEEGKRAKFGGKLPKSCKYPLKDGDEEREDNPTYENTFFLYASNKQRPQLVDREVKPLRDLTEIYAGCYVRASLSFYPYSRGENQGVGCIINGIQKVLDGEPIGKFEQVAQDFDVITEDDFLR